MRRIHRYTLVELLVVVAIAAVIPPTSVLYPYNFPSRLTMVFTAPTSRASSET